MDKYPNMCVTCLCNDRKLFPLVEMRNILQYIHFTELKSESDGICWECKNTIMKFHRFKHKALQVQRNLSLKKVENLNPQTSLGIKVNIPYNYHFNYNNPLNNENDEKIEIYIKEEIINSDDDITEIADIKTEIDITASSLEINPITCFRNSHKDIAEQSQEDAVKEHTDKFIEVIRTEEEMIKYREEKRNQHNHKKMEFKCEFCVIGFMHKDKYDAHMRNKHDKNIGPYTCHVCNVRYESMTPLVTHRRRHYVYYKCKYCKYSTSQLGAALNHCKLEHENDTDGKIHCKQCDAVLGNLEELEEHTQISHNVFCDVFGLKCINSSAVEQHRNRLHSGKRKFICDICKQTFKTKSRLETHMSRHSAAISKIMSYCKECKVQFNSIGIYRNHVNTSVQHAKITFPCWNCDKIFSSKVNRKRHYDYMHVKEAKHNCATCDKSFMLPYQLRNHNQVHHGLSRSRDHTCDDCGKKFFTNQLLLNHQQIHSDKRSYKCAHCGDTFKQRSALYNHKKLVHKGEKRKRNSCATEQQLDDN